MERARAVKLLAPMLSCSGGRSPYLTSHVAYSDSDVLYILLAVVAEAVSLQGSDNIAPLMQGVDSGISHCR